MQRVLRTAAVFGLTLGVAGCHGDDGGTMTAAGHWEPAILVGSGAVCGRTVAHFSVADLPGPQIAVNASGQALLVWSRCDGTDTTIWSARFANGAWQTAVRIGAGPDDAYPQVVLRADGSGLAVWSSYGRDGAWSARFDPSRGWAAADPFPEAVALFAGLFLDGRGTAVAAWEGFTAVPTRERPDTVAASRYLDAGWTEPQTAPRPETSDGTVTAVGADAEGRVQLLLEGPYPSSWFTRFDPRDGWSTPELVGVANALAVTAAGKAIKIAGGSRVRVERFIDGRWTGPEQVSDGFAEEPAVSLNEAGRSVAVWHGLAGVVGTHYEPGRGWSTPIRLAEDQSTGRPPLVAAELSGSATAVWGSEAADRQTGWIQAVRYENGGWRTPEHIEDTTRERPVDGLVTPFAIPDAIAADGAGVFVVWYQFRDNRVDIWARRFVP